jgi:CHAD domain-containing protein
LEPSTESLHESRKQVKYFQQALAIAANKEGRGVRKVSKRAQKVADRLGDDHDLAALQARLAAGRALSKAETKLIARIEARRAKLQKKAMKLARRVYRRKPRAFVRKLLAA